MHRKALPASLVILAGGKGQRIGTNKLFLAVNGSFLIEKIINRLSPLFEETIMSVGVGQTSIAEGILERLPSCRHVKLVEDDFDGRGPLEGLRCALRAQGTPWAFVMGCDMPYIKEEVVTFLWQFCKEDSDVVCARLRGFLEPLHAFYSHSCLSAVEKSMDKGALSLKGFYDDARVFVVEEEKLALVDGYEISFMGINTKEELSKIRDLYSSTRNSH